MMQQSREQDLHHLITVSDAQHMDHVYAVSYTNKRVFVVVQDGRDREHGAIPDDTRLTRHCEFISGTHKSWKIIVDGAIFP